MPLLTPQAKVQLDELKCKLPVEVIADLEAYATAIDSDVNYVVQKAIEKLTADKDFQQWKAQNMDKVTKSPEVRSLPKRGRKPKGNTPELKSMHAA